MDSSIKPDGTSRSRTHCLPYPTGFAMNRSRVAFQPEVPGLAARRVAADILDGVLHRGRPRDEQLDGKQAHPGLAALSDRDRALARRIIATVLRRLGTLRHLLAAF